LGAHHGAATGAFGGPCHGATMRAFGGIVSSSNGAIWGHAMGQQ